MKRPLTIAALALASVVSTAVFAQLGPKEPAPQPATDLNRVKVGQPAPDFTLEDSDGKAISLSDTARNPFLVPGKFPRTGTLSDLVT